VKVRILVMLSHMMHLGPIRWWRTLCNTLPGGNISYWPGRKVCSVWQWTCS